MEIVKITEAKEIMNGKAYALTLSDGRQCTAWNDKIEAGMIMQAWANKLDVEVVVNPYMSKAGKSGLNLISLNFAGSNPLPGLPVVNKSDIAPIPKDIAEGKPFNMNGVIPSVNLKGEIIHAECLIKESVKLLIARHDLSTSLSISDIGEALSELIPEVHGAFKVALDVQR